MSKRFAIIDPVGAVSNIAISDSPLGENWIDLSGFDPEPGVGWLYAAGMFAAPIVPDAPLPAPIRSITKLEYMNRFTDAELAGIYTAAKSEVQIEIWLEKFKLASEIDLDDAATIAGLQAMEAGGLLAAGRTAEILA